uniref:Imidazole glycerol phosphate synthase hisHF n=1 Tax=Odontella aurita TaxID=265563 RepID=A0A7S4J4W7_9STRA|mmetsp:Transcript_38416/g.115117  ORF Transcript_38416/g.115117 Transcript_38416/m.115117 type:complete len:584 (+) Transcript_38416:322-2073(+)|eukprot:CAMPEP_0113550744 /NCGR_PEP_ID=MMETSP0015_2-20120614/14149_1 /TAXON_ID=2838 /ORGANISM="Odontella" /LENGTH=583 /DNA_ID=CAMNT_0000451579 /DNA_START=296 /DNA_END=2047 /DNA_ORIENTATION=+ /assembly_acc=CAM_ASM_000160
MSSSSGDGGVVPPKRSLRVSLLDYGAGNVRSVRNAIAANGYEIDDITCPSQIETADVIVFPGVGSFGSAMRVLNEKGYVEPLRKYLSNRDRPYLGICLGMQTLFESSEESHPAGGSNEPLPGLGAIPGAVVRFDDSKVGAVPHIGWNGRIRHQDSPVFAHVDDGEEVYFVHSYYAPLRESNEEWVLTSTTYGGERYISSVQRGAVVATQFHPEKSGRTGLNIIKGFLEAVEDGTLTQTAPLPVDPKAETQLVKRVVVALDVRSNDAGDLVVTKGDQYDVRENENEGDATTAATGRGGVRNLGKPVSLAARYYGEGADEIAFLNITSFRQCVIGDLPMLQVLEESSKSIFVPLTVGGGIRSYSDPTSDRVYSAVEVASRYFRAGADKVSIGSDAVVAAEALVESGGKKTGETSIETISAVYGVQAVVVSIDPRRVYLNAKEEGDDAKHTIVELDESQSGPNGERYCWYQCTVKGGREARDICAVTVARSSESLGAGEIMLNCIDMDGQCNGFDHALMKAVSDAVTIPVIASSGAGKPKHFTDVFQETNVQAALAAGMFHRKEVEIDEVKRHMSDHGIPSRRIAV